MRFCKIENGVVTNIISGSQKFVDSLSDVYIAHEDGVSIGTEYIDGAFVFPVVEEPIAPIVKPTTDITVTSDKAMINTNLTFDFTTELPDDNYFMPVNQQGTDRVKLIVVAVNDGVGVLNVTFSESGIYYIDEAKLDTTISVNGNSSERFTLYVGE